MNPRTDGVSWHRLWVATTVAAVILGLIVLAGVLYGRSVVNELREGFIQGPATIQVSGVLEVTVPEGYMAEVSSGADTPDPAGLMLESVKVFPDSLYSMAAIEEPLLWVAAFSPELSEEVITAWQSGLDYSLDLGSMHPDWEWCGTEPSDVGAAAAPDFLDTVLCSIRVREKGPSCQRTTRPKSVSSSRSARFCPASAGASRASVRWHYVC